MCAELCVCMRERRDNRKDRETEADSRELMWCHTVDNHWCACVCLSKEKKRKNIYNNDRTPPLSC